MKYVIYVLFVVEGALLLFVSYALGYGVYWELTHEASRPTPWVTIGFCTFRILILTVLFILQIINFRQIERM